MNLESLKTIKPTRATHGRPSSTLTDKEWQNELALMKLYITPHDKSVTRMGGKFSRGQEKLKENQEYNGVIDINKYGNYAGIIQQYMFYYKAFNK